MGGIAAFALWSGLGRFGLESVRTALGSKDSRHNTDYDSGQNHGYDTHIPSSQCGPSWTWVASLGYSNVSRRCSHATGTPAIAYEVYDRYAGFSVGALVVLYREHGETTYLGFVDLAGAAHPRSERDGFRRGKISSTSSSCLRDFMPENRPKTSAPVAPQSGQFRRSEEFISGYANNIQLEYSAFDLKLIFGLLDQRESSAGKPPQIDQHTEINLSWLQAKLLIYFMELNLALYEQANGKIKIPAELLPPEIPASPQPPFDNPQGREMFELMRKIRADFIARLEKI